MDNKIKALWFSNVAFSDTKSNASGTWLHSMAEALIKTGSINLFNITHGKVKKLTQKKDSTIQQWLVPYTSSVLPDLTIIHQIQRVVEEIKPDVIHIWGLETYWGLLTARGYIKGNIILEIQGLKFAIEKHFYSGLNIVDIIDCIGIKELLRPFGSLIGQKYLFKKWGRFEREMLIMHTHISTQSDWVRANVQNVNYSATIYKTAIALRSEFVNAAKWEEVNCSPYQIFTSTSSIISYKGLHILLDSVAILKKKYPTVKLEIAGYVASGIRQDGYTKWLKKKIIKLGIYENVNWLGALDASQIVYHMKKANVVVVPSFVESYCLALDESLTVGIPTVVAYSGAMPELAVHEESALFFPPGDKEMCAYYIQKIFDNSLFAKQISYNAYQSKRINSQINVGDMQLSIYSNLINKTKDI